jgi:hypothetical protein
MTDVSATDYRTDDILRDYYYHGLLFQALPYVALLIVMLFFIYAVIGMQVSIGFISTLFHFY